MWVNILNGLLWVITLSAVVYTFILARRIRRNSSMAIERLFVMTFALLFAIAVTFFYLNNQLNHSVSGDGRGLAEIEHHDFVSQIYPPLITAQNKLAHQISRLNDLKKQILKLRTNHPQQSERLQFAYTQWLNDRKDLSQIKQNLHKSIRNAWIQHKTQDKNTVASAFSRQAVDWEKIISDRLARLQDTQLKVSNAMLDNVMLQNRGVSKLELNKNRNLASSGAVFKSAFGSTATVDLLKYLDETSPDAAEIFSRLGQEINIASQRGREVRNFALENADLKPTLDRVATSWLDLENRAIYYRDQLMHAIQASYLAVILGTNKRDNQLVRLNKTLDRQIAALYEEIIDRRMSLEKSYKTGPR